MVGTHMDLVPRTEREEKARVWLDMVNWYNSNRAHSHLYPHIMGTCFVGIPQKGKVSGVHGPDSLADFIYDVAMKMEVPNGILFIILYEHENTLILPIVHKFLYHQ